VPSSENDNYLQKFKPISKPIKSIISSLKINLEALKSYKSREAIMDCYITSYIFKKQTKKSKNRVKNLKK
jgi:hypothetical protein